MTFDVFSNKILEAKKFYRSRWVPAHIPALDWGPGSGIRRSIQSSVKTADMGGNKCKHDGVTVKVGRDPALEFGTLLHRAVVLVFSGIFDDVTCWAPIRCRNIC